MFKRAAQHLLVGYLTPENVPDPKIRRKLITFAYIAAFHSVQVKYYQFKLEAMAELGASQMTFRDFLRYEGFSTLPNWLDRKMNDDAPSIVPPHYYQSFEELEDFDQDSYHDRIDF